ncbi:hypothetical protein [Photobacterium kasasachensis]
MNTDMIILYIGYAMRFPQANRPVQGRGHWRTPTQHHNHHTPEQK